MQIWALFWTLQTTFGVLRSAVGKKCGPFYGLWRDSRCSHRFSMGKKVVPASFLRWFMACAKMKEWLSMKSQRAEQEQ